MFSGTALIVLLWLHVIPLSNVLWAEIVITVVAAFWILFWVLFTVYFFNLDMKLLSKLYPLFTKHYDKLKRNKQI